MFVVVSYDIPDDPRRTRVCETLKDYGAHIQYSVFECDLKAQDFRKLHQRLRRLIDPAEDNVRFYFLCRECQPKIEAIGQPRLELRRPYYVV